MDREEIEDMLETMLIGDSDQGKLRQLLIEHEQEMQRLRNENERLKILADCERKHVDEKLAEEHEEVWEAYGGYVSHHPGAHEHLAEELTDVITAAATMLCALGFNDVARSDVQKQVNRKNKARGYWG